MTDIDSTIATAAQTRQEVRLETQHAITFGVVVASTAKSISFRARGSDRITSLERSRITRLHLLGTYAPGVPRGRTSP